MSGTKSLNGSLKDAEGGGPIILQEVIEKIHLPEEQTRKAWIHGQKDFRKRLNGSEDIEENSK